MNVPWLCADCGKPNLIDLARLEEREESRVIYARGFTCVHCKRWQCISYTSVSVNEAEQKLKRYTPFHEQYQYMIRKLIRKVRGMGEKHESETS